MIGQCVAHERRTCIQVPLQDEMGLPDLRGYRLTDDRPKVLEGVLLRASTRSKAATVPSSVAHSTCSTDTSSGPTVARSTAPELSKAPAAYPVCNKAALLVCVIPRRRLGTT